MWFEAGTKRQKFHDRKTTADVKSLSRVSFSLNEEGKKMQICQSNIGKKKSIRLFRMTNQAIKIPHAFAVRHRDYTTSIPV